MGLQETGGSCTAEVALSGARALGYLCFHSHPSLAKCCSWENYYPGPPNLPLEGLGESPQGCIATLHARRIKTGHQQHLKLWDTLIGLESIGSESEG